MKNKKIGMINKEKAKQKINEKISKIREFPLSKMLPNMMTIMALCLGLTSVHFAFVDNYQYAMAMIIAAMILDGLDGQVARALDATSDIGAELDSLSDFVNFGVAPALVIYITTLNSWNGLGWIICIFYAVCVCLRLARFNVIMKEEDDDHHHSVHSDDQGLSVQMSKESKEMSEIKVGEKSFVQKKKYPSLPANYFLGVPAPMGAAIALLPVVISLALGFSGKVYSIFLAISLISSGVLMISRIPTFSSKGIKIKRSYVLPIMLLTMVTAAIMVTYPWFGLAGIIIAYIISIPFSYKNIKNITDSA